MIIRKTVPSDFPRVSAIYADARRRMRESGNPTQWGFVWPPEDMIREDCSPEGHGYAVVDDAGGICGVFAFYIGEDETYRVIENGAWLNDEPYGAIHRIASDGVTRGILRAAAAWCAQFVPNIRIDTHADNAAMQAALAANGFSRCGIIHVFAGGVRTDISSARVAFQKVCRK